MDPPTDEKSVHRALLPLGGGVLRITFLTCFSVIWDSLLPTPVPGAFIRLWILPRTKKVSAGRFAPLRWDRHRSALLFCFFAALDSLLPTPVPGAFIRLWILPRTKKVSTGHFFALPPVGPSFRIHLLHQKISTPNGVEIFWRSSRDSNPGDTFMPYEISSHASSTSLSTAPYNLLIIPIPRGKIKHKKHPPLKQAAGDPNFAVA